MRDAFSPDKSGAPEELLGHAKSDYTRKLKEAGVA
jgi:hypothetical protein